MGFRLVCIVGVVVVFIRLIWDICCFKMLGIVIILVSGVVFVGRVCVLL